MPTNNKVAFDNEKYLKIQKEEILKRVSSFGGKLYLEFGGKLFDDYHAARVLPGFQKDSKLQLLLNFKSKAEIVFAINSRDIETNKVRDDTGITYESEVLRLIDAYRESGLYVSSVVLCFYEENESIKAFMAKLNKFGIKTYRSYKIEGYPQNFNAIFGEFGFARNDYIETTRPLIVVTAPGPGSGKMATCLSQLYHDYKRGLKSGYAKYETFPVWNLPLKHPVNLAYEAATVDLNDINMIDPYHLEAYGKTAVNYNRDVEVYPVLEAMFKKIYGESPYKSPTDMGVNKIGFAIKNEAAAIEASKQEVIRRYYQARKNVFLGKFQDSALVKSEFLLEELGINPEDRKCVDKALKREKECGEPCIAIEINSKKVVVGHRSPLLGAPAAALLNALKTLAHIDDSFNLISPSVIEPIQKLKTGPLKKQNPRIRAEEILILLAIQAKDNPLADAAYKALPKLNGLQAHASCVLSDADTKTFKQLGIQITEEPVAYAHKLYFK